MIVPCSAIFIALARPMVVALLERGAFSSGDATVVAHTVAGFSLGLVPFSIYLFSLRVLLAARHAHAVRPELLRERLEHRAAFPLYCAFGVPASRSPSPAYSGAAVLTIIVLRRRLGYMDGRRLIDTLARSLAAGGLVALVTWMIARGLGWSNPWVALGTTVVGAGRLRRVLRGRRRAPNARARRSLVAVRAPGPPRAGLRPDAPTAIGVPSDREGRTV